MAHSRAEIQRWLEDGRVTIDGAVAQGRSRLREGAFVVVDPLPPPTTELLADASVVFDLIHADDDIVVLMKPAGLVVHPAAGNWSGTLVHGLLAKGWFQKIAASSIEGEALENLRPGIVHRLDKGTSGVMVVARHALAREALKAQFAAHSIEREYEAIVVGTAPSMTHRSLIGRNEHDRLRFTTRVRAGKAAVTHVDLVRVLRGGVASHVRCRLETGRTHQIRVHLAESGTPVLGDPLYGREPDDALLRAQALALGHQALHARVLGFLHPTSGLRMRFEAPLPPDFAGVLKHLSKA